MSIVSASRRDPINLKVGDIITIHPDHPDQHGAWTVTAKPEALDPFTVAHTWKSGERVAIDYRTEDGGTGRFVVAADARLAVKDDQKAAYTAALRQLADAIDDDPDVEMPYTGALSSITFPRGGSAEAFSKTFGRPDEVDVGGTGQLHLTWNLGGLKVKTSGPECEEKVTGIRIVDDREVPVTEYVIPEQYKTATAEKAQVPA